MKRARKAKSLIQKKRKKKAPQSEFGFFARQEREKLAKGNPAFSLRQTARRAGMSPEYLSMIERGVMPAPSEKAIFALSQELGASADVMLALAGKVSAELRQIILARPVLFADLLRQLKTAPNGALLKITREVRDGAW